MSRYILCGTVSPSFDFFLYVSLSRIGMQIDLAKAIGFLSASVMSYFLNRKFTFKGTESNLAQFISFFIVHCFAMVIDVSVNKGMLMVLSQYINHSRVSFTLAFIVATGISVIANFSGQKFWVFKLKIKG
jgi:putative flippase GtrA